ncbi:hypothetical protein OS493_003828 [Desmophyllum pertusum]|uniref:Uncharacterized protein n=1 Tax=Desmophyllum pertusum TaxID=174260 RepID=A0A9X0A9S7_9CNID|nr:hypothetical protein OS493_003828 [Desmophyllum pertusum]
MVPNAKSEMKKLVAKETQQEMVPLSGDDSKTTRKEELVLGYTKFHKGWMDQLLNTRSRKP